MVAKILDMIKNEAFEYIRASNKCSELDVQMFILDKYNEHGLKTALGKPIVAFGPSAASPHYDPSKGKLRHLSKGDVIMADLWARLNEPRAPYGDITWMGFKGTKPTLEIQKGYDTVIRARDASLSLLRNMLRNRQLPAGREVDAGAMKVLLDAGYEYRKQILHTTGHSLGTTSPHGTYGAISSRNKNKLKKNLGYTIEPGVYIKGKFGVRSEIDFYITNDDKLVVTSIPQNELLLL